MDLRVRILAVALCASATHASGQNVPRQTLFTGYSYMHGLPTSDTVSLNGWAAELTVNLTRRLGLAGNFSGDYGSSSAITGVFTDSPISSGIVSLPTVTIGQARARVTNHTLLFGPECRLVQNRRTAISLTAGIGIARATLNSPVFIFGSVAQTRPTLLPVTGFAAGGGVSADIRLTQRIAYRAVQFRFIGADCDFGWQRSLQLATGLVVYLK
jgi:hypothetical protein